MGCVPRSARGVTNIPRNGSGQYSAPVGTLGVTGTVISSTAYDNFIADLSTEITSSVNVNGTAPMLAALNMGTFKITNAATPVAATDVAIKSYVDNGQPTGSVIFLPDAFHPPTPTGFLACDGSLVSTTTYANLFALIGYTYGGSGANFNLPFIQGVALGAYIVAYIKF